MGSFGGTVLRWTKVARVALREAVILVQCKMRPLKNEAYIEGSAVAKPHRPLLAPKVGHWQNHRDVVTAII